MRGTQTPELSIAPTMSEAGGVPSQAPSHGGWREYLAIARLDHMTKHVFIIPGIILAWVLLGPSDANVAPRILVGLLSAVCIASANYVINEWLDREFDQFHPEKSSRIAVQWQLSPAIIYAEYAAFLAAGLLLAQQVGQYFFWTSVAFAVSGIIYNVRPFRTKDRPYLDVVSESINNPIRLMLGWYMVVSSTLPPGSLLLAYWAGGAFLMGAKRLSEYRDLCLTGELDVLQRYRRSFRFYTAENLTVSCFLYALISAFGLAVFLIRYRLEYILAFPFIAVLFASYLWLALRENSIARRPERLFRSRRLMAATAFTAAALLILSFVDLPDLKSLSAPGFVPVKEAQ